MTNLRRGWLVAARWVAGNELTEAERFKINSVPANQVITQVYANKGSVVEHGFHSKKRPMVSEHLRTKQGAHRQVGY